MTTRALGTAREDSAIPDVAPPFDPELAVALAAIAEHIPRTSGPDLIAAMRQTDGALPSDDELSRDGAFEITERQVPGPAGAPDVPLLICRPRQSPGRPRPSTAFTAAA